MLGKLIRYDFKVQLKFLMSVYAVAVFVGIVSGVFQGLYDRFQNVGAIEFVHVVSNGFCIIAALAVVIGTIIYVVLYYRRNLFKDEGYLMHTLPVTEAQLYLSKLVTGIFCIMLSLLTAYLVYGIGILNIGWGKTLLLESIRQSEVSEFMMITWCVLLISIPANLCQFYASLTIGYTWKLNTQLPVNKDLLSVIAYVAIYSIQQFVLIISIIIYSFVKYSSIARKLVESINSPESKELFRYTQEIMYLSEIFVIIIAVVLSAVSIYRMKHHLNQE